MTVSLELRLAIASHYSEKAYESWLGCAISDWEQLAHEAVVERLAPLLYYSLQKFPRDIPVDAHSRLREVYYATGARNTRMLWQLKRVTDVLDQIDVRYILLKGVALIEDVYEGNVGLRPMSDVDILVDSADIPRIYPAIKEIAQFAPLLLRDENNFSQHEYSFYPVEDVHVEMHTRLVRYAFYANRPAFAKLATQSIKTFTPEWQFLHLCVHAYLHHEGEIAHFGADAAFVLQNEIDWDVVIRNAEENRMVLPLQWGVSHLAKTWFVEIPPEIMRRIGQLKATSAEKFYVYCARHAAFRRLGTWVALPTWQLKMRFLWATVFPSHAYLRHRWGDEQTQTRLQLYRKRIAAIPKRLFEN